MVNTKLFRRLILPTSVDVNEVLNFEGLPVKKIRLIYTNKSSSSSSASKVTINGLSNDKPVLLGVVGNQYVNQIELEFPKINNELPTEFLLSVIHGSSSNEQDITVEVVEYDATAKGSTAYFETNTEDIVVAQTLNE